MTSRFTETTRQQNAAFRAKIGAKCLYSSPTPISSAVPNNAIMFVLEMNNTDNKIMGIGLLKNIPIYHKYEIYDNNNVNNAVVCVDSSAKVKTNYNMFQYVGKYRIDYENMTERDKQILQILEIMCFTGSRHLKRLKGITIFPEYMLNKCKKMVDLLDYIIHMFKAL
jgi:hypothetical protein